MLRLLAGAPKLVTPLEIPREVGRRTGLIEMCRARTCPPAYRRAAAEYDSEDNRDRQQREERGSAHHDQRRKPVSLYHLVGSQGGHLGG
jgi:hypothetical protein